MTRYLVAAVAAAALAVGCATPPQTVSLGVSFDAAAAQRQLADGPNIVRGSAFLRQQGGGVVTCAGAEVTMIPATPYAQRVFAVLYGSPSGAGRRIAGAVSVEPRSDQFGQMVRRAQCDAQGNFVFDRVADGDWFVETKVTWLVGRDLQGGAIMRRVNVSGGAVQVILAP